MRNGILPLLGLLPILGQRTLLFGITPLGREFANGINQIEDGLKFNGSLLALFGRPILGVQVHWIGRQVNGIPRLLHGRLTIGLGN